MGKTEPTPEHELHTMGEFPVSWAVFALARTHRAKAAALLGSLGLFPGQELILLQLWESDGLSQKTLGAMQKLDHSTIAKSIKRLEEAGLVRRERSPEDARVSLVHLTDAGRSLEPATRAAWAELERYSVRNLTAAERHGFIRLVAKITANER